jgi:hypothetical protein
MNKIEISKYNAELIKKYYNLKKDKTDNRFNDISISKTKICRLNLIAEYLPDNSNTILHKSLLLCYVDYIKPIHNISFEKLVIHVLSHEFMHYILHKEHGLNECVSYDNLFMDIKKSLSKNEYL